MSSGCGTTYGLILWRGLILRSGSSRIPSAWQFIERYVVLSNPSPCLAYQVPFEFLYLRRLWIGLQFGFLPLDPTPHFAPCKACKCVELTLLCTGTEVGKYKRCMRFDSVNRHGIDVTRSVVLDWVLDCYKVANTIGDYRLLGFHVY